MTNQEFNKLIQKSIQNALISSADDISKGLTYSITNNPINSKEAEIQLYVTMINNAVNTSVKLSVEYVLELLEELKIIDTSLISTAKLESALNLSIRK